MYKTHPPTLTSSVRNHCAIDHRKPMGWYIGTTSGASFLQNVGLCRNVSLSHNMTIPLNMTLSHNLAIPHSITVWYDVLNTNWRLGLLYDISKNWLLHAYDLTRVQIASRKIHISETR
jgi:hypothetical protein